MKFAFVYQGGSVPKEKAEQINKDWYAWSNTFTHDEGFRPMGTGKTISLDSIDDYTGDIRGYNVVEFDSMEKAIETAQKCPILAFGGRVQILDPYKG